MRISIDPNVRTKGNQTRTGFEDVFGEVDELSVGDAVIAMGEGSDFIWDAEVSRIDYDRRLIWLDVPWRLGRVDE